MFKLSRNVHVSVALKAPRYAVKDQSIFIPVNILLFPQVPESFGPIRTIAEGRGETVLIGTTKNFVLQGSLDGEFMPITQVSCMHIFIYSNTIEFGLI